MYISSAKEHGVSAAAFHQRCDNKSNLLVVARNTAGYVFGGYACKPWTSVSKDTYTSDENAFLFRLRKKNERNFELYQANNAAIVSWYDNKMGPAFGRHTGSDSGNIGLYFFYHDGFPQYADGSFDVNLSVSLSTGFDNKGHSDDELHGGDNRLYNLDVYQLSGRVCIFVFIYR